MGEKQRFNYHVYAVDDTGCAYCYLFPRIMSLAGLKLDLAYTCSTYAEGSIIGILVETQERELVSQLEFRNDQNSVASVLASLSVNVS